MPAHAPAGKTPRCRNDRPLWQFQQGEQDTDGVRLRRRQCVATCLRRLPIRALVTKSRGAFFPRRARNRRTRGPPWAYLNRASVQCKRPALRNPKMSASFADRPYFPRSLVPLKPTDFGASMSPDVQPSASNAAMPNKAAQPHAANPAVR